MVRKELEGRVASMARSKEEVIQIGDWVSGTSIVDQKVIGYVESMDIYGGIKVHVTQSDHERAIGYVVESRLAKLEKLNEYIPSDEIDLRSLMDLALATRDQPWFEELGAALRKLQPAGSGHSAHKRVPNRPNSRRIKID
jgi:hypothetical protein